MIELNRIAVMAFHGMSVYVNFEYESSKRQNIVCKA